MQAGRDGVDAGPWRAPRGENRTGDAMPISAKDVKELRERTNAPMMECKTALTESGGDLQEAARILRERGIAKAAKRSGRETAEGLVAVKLEEGNRGATGVKVVCETDFSARSDAFGRLVDAVLEAARSLSSGQAGPEAVLAQKTPSGATVKQVMDDTANQIRENMSIAEVVRHEGICGTYRHFDGRSAAIVEVEVESPDAATAPGVTEVLRELCMHIVAAQPAPLALDESGIPQDVLEEERSIYIKQAMDSGKPKEIAEKIVAGRMKKLVAERALLRQPFVKDPSKTVSDHLRESASAAGTGITIKGFSRLQIGG